MLTRRANLQLLRNNLALEKRLLALRRLNRRSRPRRLSTPRRPLPTRPRTQEREHQLPRRARVLPESLLREASRASANLPSKLRLPRRSIMNIMSMRRVMNPLSMQPLSQLAETLLWLRATRSLAKRPVLAQVELERSVLALARLSSPRLSRRVTPERKPTKLENPVANTELSFIFYREPY